MAFARALRSSGDRLMGLIVYRMHLVPPDRSDLSDNPCVSDQDTSYSPPTSLCADSAISWGGGRLLPIATTRRETYGSLMALVTSACISFTLMVRGGDRLNPAMSLREVVAS